MSTPWIVAWAVLLVAIYAATWRLTNGQWMWRMIYSNLAISGFNIVVVAIMLISRMGWTYA